MSILIKLNNANETNGIFTNTFDENITLKPFSKIGLLNAVIDTVDDAITVDNKCFLTLTQAAKDILTIQIPPGNYSVQEFINTLTGYLNKCLIMPTDPDKKNIRGMQMKAVRNSADNKISIFFNRCDNDGYSMATVSEKTNILYETDGGYPYYIRAANIPDNQWTSWIYSRRYFTKGAGKFTGIITLPPENMGNQYFAEFRALIGLIPVDEFDSTNPIISPDTCRYCIWVEAASDNSRLVTWTKGLNRTNGIWETFEGTTTTVMRNGYGIELFLSEGKLIFRRLPSQ